MSSKVKTSKSYFARISSMLRTAMGGLSLTGKKMRGKDLNSPPPGIQDPNYFSRNEGRVTIQYPQEKIPVPANGRYRLYMETEDCIGCDKCARICPVDCITIETFRADGDLGKTSDGTVKRLHLPVFDIDMAKCMFCGLCTTVCPTECLYMTPVFDYSEFDRDNFVYHFGAYSPGEEQRIRKETEAALAQKAAEKAAQKKENPEAPAGKPILKKPVIGLSGSQEVQKQESEQPAEEKQKPAIKKPLFKKPQIPKADSGEGKEEQP